MYFKKLVIIGVVSSFILSGCDSGSVDSSNTVDVSEETDNETDDEEEIDFEFVTDGAAYAKPKYNVSKCVKLNNYKDLVVDVTGVHSPDDYTDQVLNDTINEVLFSFSEVKVTDSETCGKKDTGVLCDTKYQDLMNKAYKADKDLEDYYIKDTSYSFDHLDKKLVAKFKKAKVGDEIEWNDDKNGKVIFFVNGFGKFVELTLDNVTNDFIANQFGYNTVKEYKNAVKSNLIDNSKKTTYSCIIDALLNECEVEVPEDLLKYEMNKTLHEEELEVASLNEYENMDEYMKETQDTTFEEYAVGRVDEVTQDIKMRLILEAIVKDNKVKPNKKAYWDAFMQYMSESYDLNVSELELGEDYYELDYYFNKVYMGLMWCSQNLKCNYEL